MHACIIGEIVAFLLSLVLANFVSCDRCLQQQKMKNSDRTDAGGALRYLIASLVVYGNCLQLLAHHTYICPTLLMYLP